MLSRRVGQRRSHIFADVSYQYTLTCAADSAASNCPVGRSPLEHCRLECHSNNWRATCTVAPYANPACLRDGSSGCWAGSVGATTCHPRKTTGHRPDWLLEKQRRRHRRGGSERSHLYARGDGITAREASHRRIDSARGVHDDILIVGGRIDRVGQACRSQSRIDRDAAGTFHDRCGNVCDETCVATQTWRRASHVSGLGVEDGRGDVPLAMQLSQRSPRADHSGAPAVLLCSLSNALTTTRNSGVEPSLPLPLTNRRLPSGMRSNAPSALEN